MGSDQPRSRHFHIDLIKAVFALLVVMVHCMRAGWDPGATRFEIWFGSAVAILVTPAFLFCAGFLAATPASMTGPAMRRRLRRLLLPYLLASVLAEAFRASFLGESIDARTVILDLLLADAFGPYYFVFHMLVLTPLSFWLSRLGASARRGLWLLFLCTGAVRSVDVWITWPGLAPELGVIMLVRNPFIYWGFFLSGWEARMGQPAVRAFLDRHRGQLLAPVSLVVTAGAVEAWFTPGWRTPWLSYPLIYGVLVGLSLAPGAPAGSAVAGLIRWLSDRTYSYYLFHLFFVMTAQRLLPHAPGEFSLSRFAVHYGASVAAVSLMLLARDAVVSRRRASGAASDRAADRARPPPGPVV